MNVYEDVELQAYARSKIDMALVQQHAGQSRTGRWQDAADDVAFVLGLLKWFKRDFFSWTNKPKCDRCGIAGPRVESIGMTGPNAAEERGWAGRVELYKCKECDVITRFPRYNNPRMLLETRNGRCGEWANCFTLVCRACGLDARWVLDWTDHVWTEVWIESLQRYVHADPCENRLDTPLMYESGWKKKLTYVVAFSAHGVSDATARYTRKMPELLTRRLACTEHFFDSVIRQYDQQQLQSYNQRIAAESIAARRAADAFEIRGLLLARPQPKAVHSEEKMGRITGDEEWKRARGELGDQPAESEEEPGVCGEDADAAFQAAFSDFRSVDLPFRKNAAMTGRLSWQRCPNIALATPDQPLLDVFVCSAGYADVNDVLHIRSCDPWVCATTPKNKAQLYSSDAIRINGVPACASGRGHNVVSIDKASGTLVDSVSFDSYEDRMSGAKLAKHLSEMATRPVDVMVTVIDSGENLARGSSKVAALHRALQPLIPDLPPAERLVPRHRASWLVRSELGRNDSNVSATATSSVCSAPQGEGPVFRRFIQQNPVDSSLAYELHRCEGLRCSNAVSLLPTDVAAREEQESGSEFAIAAASRFCLGRPDVLGFTHVPQVGILLFSESGYPLVPQAGCTSFIKRVASFSDRPPASTVDLPTELCFSASRGSHHPDTRAFDDSTFVVGVLRSLLSHSRRHGEQALSWRALWASLRVSAVRYFGGSFAHGVQLRYQLGTQFQFWGPARRGDDHQCDVVTVELEVRRQRMCCCCGDLKCVTDWNVWRCCCLLPRSPNILLESPSVTVRSWMPSRSRPMLVVGAWLLLFVHLVFSIGDHVCGLCVRAAGSLLAEAEAARPRSSTCLPVTNSSGCTVATVAICITSASSLARIRQSQAAATCSCLWMSSIRRTTAPALSLFGSSLSYASGTNCKIAFPSVRTSFFVACPEGLVESG